MLDAMRVAAEKRIEEILTHSRRRHYGHAATLAASCLACAPRDTRPPLPFGVFLRELVHALVR